jgi:hypothetical protein
MSNKEKALIFCNNNLLNFGSFDDFKKFNILYYAPMELNNYIGG